MHAANAEHGVRVYRYLRDDLGARFVQFLPIVERAGVQDATGSAPVADWSVGPDQYGRFLIDVFEEWVRHDIGSVYVQMFDSALASWVGAPAGMCVHAETCGRQLVLEHNGDLYCCDHYVDAAHRLGNITRTPLIELASRGGSGAVRRR